MNSHTCAPMYACAAIMQMRKTRQEGKSGCYEEERRDDRPTFLMTRTHTHTPVSRHLLLLTLSAQVEEVDEEDETQGCHAKKKKPTLMSMLKQGKEGKCQNSGLSRVFIGARSVGTIKLSRGNCVKLLSLDLRAML